MVTPERFDPGPSSGPMDDVAAAAVVDEHGTVRSWSRSAESLLGYTPDEVLGKPAALLLALPPMTAEGLTPAEPSRPEGSWSGLASLRHRDGHTLDLRLRGLPVTVEDGHPGWLVSAAGAPWTPWSKVSPTVLEQLSENAPFSLAVFDLELRYLWVNAELERVTGLRRDHFLGRRIGEMYPGFDDEAIETQMNDVLGTGVPTVDFEWLGRPRADPDRMHLFSASFYRLDDEAGQVLGLCAVIIDNTDHHRARQRLALLNAAQDIGTTLDVMQTAQDIANVAVPDLADFVTVDLLESVIQGEDPAPGPLSEADMALLRRAGQQSVREGCPEELVAVGDLADHRPGDPVVLSLSAGKPWLGPVTDFLTGDWPSLDPVRAEHIRRLGIHSMMVIPIRAQSVTLGAAMFCRWQSQDPFYQDDLALAEEFVARASIGIDNARRYTREHNAALALQRSLLPHGAPDQSAVEVASCYLPADVKTGVGGDWFDLIPLSGTRVALVVGDVVGHGLHAAATMGRLRTAVRTLADLDLSPEEVLAHLDDMVGHLSDEHGTGEPVAGAVGATCLYAVYDPVSRRCTMARAGHPPPMLADPDGTAHLLDLPACPPLGLGTLPFESAGFELPEGSLLALYTNGLVATRDTDVDTQLDQLRLALADRPDRSLQERLDGVITHVLPPGAVDDVALLLARTCVLDADQVASWDVPVDPAMVSEIRALAMRQLSTWGLEDIAFATELVISELVTNAIRYGSAPIRLRLIRDRALICEVSDSSSTAPHLRHARTTDEGGRGLFLVSQLTQRWGTRYGDGKTIWAEQSLYPVTVELGMEFDLE